MKRARGMIAAGTYAARRMSSRLRGSRGNRAFWRPVTLHWRRTPRLRVPHRENQQKVSWTLIFAPRILRHFSSNLTAAANSTLFASTSSILKPLLTQCSSILHHRETWRTYFSRKRLFSRSSERHSSVTRVDLIHLSLPRRGVDLASRPGPSPFPRTDRSLSITGRSNIRTTRVSNTVPSRAHHSVSSFITVFAPTAYRRERTSTTSLHSTEPARAMPRTELVWRQPLAAAKSDGHGIRRDVFETPQSSVPAAFDSARANALPVNRPAVSAFDAAQMDRLVDNVIQRVEKRVRIEHERRGW
jgi:hypothetical protein